MGLLMDLGPVRDLLFKSCNPAEAERALQPYMTQHQTPEEQRAVVELMGLALRAQQRYADAMRVYEGIRDFYQAGYCAMLYGDLMQVQAHWTKTLQERQNHWCATLYGMITRQLRTFPTLFQVRNHLESDIANLVGAGQLQYLNNLLDHVDFMTQLNLEAPKFAGRALMHSGLPEQAGGFLLKGQRALPNDPEIYFHLGQYSVKQRHLKEAELMLKQCLLISPSYTPARELLSTLPPSRQNAL